MRSKKHILYILLFLLSFVIGTSASIFGAVAPVHYRHVHRRYYIRHRSKWQHAKIIGGAAKTGASIGGLIGGPPGMAAGAAVGAGAGTAYDLKTRKQTTRHRLKERT